MLLIFFYFTNYKQPTQKKKKQINILNEAKKNPLLWREKMRNIRRVMQMS